MADYLPVKESDLSAWINNFLGKLRQHGELVGFPSTHLVNNLPLPTAEFSKIERICSNIVAIISGGNSLKNRASAFVDYKDNYLYGDGSALNAEIPEFTFGVEAVDVSLDPTGVLSFIRSIVKRIKAHPNYTTAIGQDLGIIGEQQTQFSVNSVRPSLALMVNEGNSVEVKFKKGKFDGILLQCKKATGDFETVGNVISSPFDDKTPSANDKPEKREYRAKYLNGNETVGQFSDVVTVVTNP